MHDLDHLVGQIDQIDHDLDHLVGQIDQIDHDLGHLVGQIDHIPISRSVDHLDPNLPLWDVLHHLCSTDPTQETCFINRSCRSFGSRPPTWARSYRSDRSDRSYRSGIYLPWNIQIISSGNRSYRSSARGVEYLLLHSRISFVCSKGCLLHYIGYFTNLLRQPAQVALTSAQHVLRPVRPVTDPPVKYRLVQVKRRKCMLRPKSTPFFRVKPWIFAHVFYEPLQRPDLLFFCMIFRQLRLYGNFGHLRPSVFGEKKKRRSGVEMDIEHVCNFSGSYHLKTAWTFGLLCGKHVKFA